MTIKQDHEQLLACWDRTHLNGATSHVAQWCGWTFDEALTKLLALREAGLVSGNDRDAEYGGRAVYPSGPNAGKPLHFWVRPKGAHGLPFVEDPRVLALGIIRALRTDDQKLIYQGSRPLDVYRAAKRDGLSIAGWRLEWLGPDPTGKKQLDIPLGVILDS